MPRFGVTTDDTSHSCLASLWNRLLCASDTVFEKKCASSMLWKHEAERHRCYYLLPYAVKALIICIYTKLKMVLQRSECQQKNCSFLGKTHQQMEQCSEKWCWIFDSAQVILEGFVVKIKQIIRTPSKPFYIDILIFWSSSFHLCSRLVYLTATSHTIFRYKCEPRANMETENKPLCSYRACNISETFATTIIETWPLPHLLLD